jgi:hypothetical protein
MRTKLFALLLILAAVPALAAQTEPRPLEVPSTAAWKHAESEMILPPTVDGFARVGIRDTGVGELDVIADYRSEPDEVWATVYLYKTQVQDVALWFDRGLFQILQRQGHQLAGTAAPVPTAFARPNAANASGLRIALDTEAPAVASTALAIAPVGGFLLKVRMSATGLDREALEARLTRFVAGLRWPAETARAARAAVPILPCSSPLRLRRARVVRSTGADALLDALSAITLPEDEARAPPIYCRERDTATSAYAVYRADGARDAYLIALSDSGLALSVAESLDIGALSGGGSGGRRIALTLLDRERTVVLPSFNRLPLPEQAIEAAGFGTAQ